MADIKTRLVNKGDVKTIDRAANLSSRLRSAEVRTKDQVAGPAGRDGENESQYANDNMVQMGKDVAYGSARGVRDGMSRAGHGLKSNRENTDIKTKADMIRKSRGVTDGTGLSRKTSDKKLQRQASLPKKQAVPEGSQHMQWRLERSCSRQGSWTRPEDRNSPQRRL